MQSLQNLIRKGMGSHYDGYHAEASSILKLSQLVACGLVLSGNLFRVRCVATKVLLFLSALPLLIVGIEGLIRRACHLFSMAYPSSLGKCYSFFAGDNASKLASTFSSYVLLFVKWASVAVKVVLVLVTAFSLVFGSFSFFSALSALLLMAWALTYLLFDFKLKDMTAVQKDCICMLISTLTLIISVLFFGFLTVPLVPMINHS